MTRSLTFEEMQKLNHDMSDEIGTDPDALDLYADLMQAVTKYAEYRMKWRLLSREEKMDMDSYRTAAHNSVITHVNMLSRYLKSIGKEAKWRDALGYEEDDPYNRKRIGDFACYLAFVNGLNAR